MSMNREVSLATHKLMKRAELSEIKRISAGDKEDARARKRAEQPGVDSIKRILIRFREGSSIQSIKIPSR
jgi:hypothetical protein